MMPWPIDFDDLDVYIYTLSFFDCLLNSLARTTVSCKMTTVICIPSSCASGLSLKGCWLEEAAMDDGNGIISA